jgi:hypothetical protein
MIIFLLGSVLTIFEYILYVLQLIQIMDFSDAEYNGFIDAFISFWIQRLDDNRNEDDLRKNAQHILRGCKEHFRSGVTRLSRINGVIPLKCQPSGNTRTSACSSRLLYGISKYRWNAIKHSAAVDSFMAYLNIDGMP